MASVGRMVKDAIVEELSTELTQRPNFFVTAIGRLPASAADAFRRKLSTSQARLLMVNRRLGRRALEPLNIAGLQELLKGSVGLVLAGGDVLPIAKLIVEFCKSHEEQVAVKGAVIDGQLLDPSTVEALANLPPKAVLLAQVVATIESPIADLIWTIEQLLGDVTWIVAQAAAKKPAEPAPTPPPPGGPTATPEDGPQTGATQTQTAPPQESQ